MCGAIPRSGMTCNEKDNVAFLLDASQPNENPSCCVSLLYSWLKWQSGDIRGVTRLPSNQGSIIENVGDVTIRRKTSPETPKLVYTLTQPSRDPGVLVIPSRLPSTMFSCKMFSCVLQVPAAQPGAAWGNLVGLITTGWTLSHTISKIGVNNIILINVHKCQQTLAHSECRGGGGRWERWRGGGSEQRSHCHWSTNAAYLWARLCIDDQWSMMATEEETGKQQQTGERYLRCHLVKLPWFSVGKRGGETDLTKRK